MHPNDAELNEYADASVDASRRGEIERHLEACTSCRQVVAELREIARVAATLELRDPPVRSWTRLERAIKLDAATERLPQNSRNSRRTFDLRVQRALREMSVMGRLAAAAALVLATAVGVQMMRGSAARRPASAPAATATAPAPAPAAAAQSVEAELRQAEDHYEKAIQGLEQIANAEQSVFDPRTAATLQKNLAVIDQAISESRAALRTEPASEPAQQSLLENFKAKVALLQDTVALINEMRKGNEAGAARIVSGLKQKGD